MRNLYLPMPWGRADENRVYGVPALNDSTISTRGASVGKNNPCNYRGNTSNFFLVELKFPD